MVKQLSEKACKICSTCGLSKPLLEFGKKAKHPDGLQYSCKKCLNIVAQEYYRRNAEYKKAYAKDYRKDNIEKISAYNKKYRQENKEYYAEYQKKRVKENPETCYVASRRWAANNKERVRETKKLWDRRNRDVARRHGATRRASKRDRTPPWLTELQKEEIQMFYTLARDCEVTTGEKYHVDHIVPLQGENVCGLHVPWNLQVLPSDINIAKSNRYYEDH